jgi:hypothetical protein
MTTQTSRQFTLGMRVVVRDGPWPVPRVAGHYGKIDRIVEPLSGDPLYRVNITGHADGGAVDPMVANDPAMQIFYSEELDVID